MIKNLTIQNFLSHKKTELELSLGVNIIVGPTDSGKSAIIRALKWLVWNRPVGESFRSNWGGDTVVGIELEDRYVCRAKGKGGNEYRIEHPNPEKGDDIFKAIKTDVPEEIKKILNLNETNLQTQFESHFLLSKSAGEVAAHFNKVAHLDKIDKGLSTIQSWFRGIERNITTDEKKLEEYSEDLTEFDALPRIEERIERLEYISTKQKELRLNAKEIKNIIEDVQDLEKEIVSHKSFVEVQPLVNEILKYFKLINQKEIELNDLEGFIMDIEDCEEEIKRLKKFTSMEKEVNSLLEIGEDITKKEKDQKKLGKLVFKIETVENLSAHAKEDIEEYEKEFHKQLGKRKICPLCGSIIKK